MATQTILFKNIDVKKLDDVLFELHNSIYAMKTLALRIETSTNIPNLHLLPIECGKEIAALCKSISDLSLRYLDHPETYWDKVWVYNPYYAALEPRSLPDLYDLSRDYQSRLEAFLLRLEAILRNGSIVMPKEIRRVREKFKTMVTAIGYEKFKL
jgi:hypothetical protein